MKKSQIIKIIVCFLPLLLLFLPAPAGMNPKAWELFPFYAGAILGIMLHPFSEAAILLIFLGFYSVTMKGQAVALSGYALAMTWLVVGAFVIAQAFRDTQLGKRIAYHLIRIFGRSAIGLGYAAAFSDFIIAPMTPSNAAASFSRSSARSRRRLVPRRITTRKRSAPISRSFSTSSRWRPASRSSRVTPRTVSPGR